MRLMLKKKVLMSSLLMFYSVLGVAAEFETEMSEFPDVTLEMQEIDNDFFRVGQFVQASRLADVIPGTSGRRVTEILGTPEAVSREGVEQFWHYNINLPLAGGEHQLVCQYRVGITQSLLVDDTEWRREQCRLLYAQFMDNHIVYMLPADILFEFDSTELDAEGRRTISDIGGMIMDRSGPSTIHVVGYTDHLGSREYNQNLSEERASTVKSQLVVSGVPDSWVSTEGNGQDNPVVLCPGEAVTPTLISCLAPNRRVRVEVADQQ